MHNKSVVVKGRELKDAQKVLIMIHGRGGSAEDILSISRHLNVEDYALVAPQAKNNTWYPYSFLAPISENEPHLSSALSVLQEIVEELLSSGLKSHQLYFLGFSQGACLTLEFVARNARKWGGVVAFTGGLIGDKIYKENYSGDFDLTPIFIGTSDPDPHVPVQRVMETTKTLAAMNAAVTEKIYKNMGHKISPEEIAVANELVFKG